MSMSTSNNWLILAKDMKMTAMNNNAIEQARELVRDGATKGKVEGFLKYMHDASTNEAKEWSAKAFELEGMTPSGYSHATHEETVKYLRANYGKVSKKDLINGMCEVNGNTFKTNQHAYNYIAMMIEWAKQEVEAQS
jgi:hypothetical protein